ncbi:MAG: hypothetical protein ACXAC7_10695 [Candidatus Hodarchaeales archaeon]
MPAKIEINDSGRWELLSFKSRNFNLKGNLLIVSLILIMPIIISFALQGPPEQAVVSIWIALLIMLFLLLILIIINSVSPHSIRINLVKSCTCVFMHISNPNMFFELDYKNLEVDNILEMRIISYTNEIIGKNCKVVVFLSEEVYNYLFSSYS